ncbi:hypothetical protein [Sinomicrobium sp.]
MSKWISLSGASSGSKATETSRHNYVIFEVPVGQKAIFQLDVERIRSLQSKKHRMYFVAQGVDNFGEESWLEWKSGPAPMALHEYFNQLNGGAADYSPESVKHIGRNYITAFETLENGQTNWSQPSYLSYTPEQAGQGIWLESLYYSPDWGGMGAFIIGVDQPKVLSFFAKKREFRAYDSDENFIRGDVQSLEGIRYGDTVYLHIETHRIIPGRYTAEVDILYQGTRIYNGAKRLELDKYANPANPALEYNLQMQEALFVDSAWQEATGHPNGTTLDYTIRFTFSPKDVLENRTDGGFTPGSPVIREFTLKVTTTFLDFIIPVMGQTPQIVSVNEETLTPINHDECRFSALEVVVKDQEPIEILKENREQGVLSVNLINPVIPVIAGNGDDQEIIVQLEDVHTEECEGNPSHHNNIFVYNEAVGTWSPKESEDKLVLKPKYVYPRGMQRPTSISDISIEHIDVREVLKYIWPARDSLAQQHRLDVSTCRYFRSIDIKVYPDIKWELAVEFIINQSNYKAANMPPGNIFAKHQEKSRKAGYKRWLMNRRGKVPISIGLGLSAEWNDGSSKRSFTNEFADRIQLVAEVISNSVNILQGAINSAQGLAKATAIPIGFDIRYPKFVIVGKWFLESGDQLESANTIGEVGLGFKPLIGAEMVIDILGAAITAVSYGTTGNPAAAKIISKFRQGLDKLGASVVFTATFYGELEIEIEALRIDERNGIDMQGKSTIGGRMGVMIELGISAELGKANGAKFMPIDVSFRAAARAHGFFGGELTINSDEEGLFIQPTLKFSGIMLSVEIEGEVGWWKSNFKVEEKVIDEDTVPLEKKYFTK